MGHMPTWMKPASTAVELPRRLKSLRRKIGMTQAVLAEKAIVTQQSIINWEFGRNYPSPACLERLAEALGVSQDTLKGQ